MHQQKLDYEAGVNCLLRRLFFLHALKACLRIRALIISDPQKPVTIEDLPEIKLSEKASVLAESFSAQLMDEEERSKPMKIGDIYSALYQTMKWDIWFIQFLYFLTLTFRIAVTMSVQQLLIALETNNYSLAYIIAGFISIALYLLSAVHHNSFYQGPIISGKVRSTLISLIFNRIVRLTQHTADREELGRISNMLSNDFNLLEIKAPFFFGLLICPIAYVSFFAIMIYRLGVEGIICLCVPIIFIPFQIWLGRVNGKMLVDVNLEKDHRVKITTEIIDSIKSIKIYGWETALSRIIGQIRKREVAKSIKLWVGRCLETSISTSTVYMGAFLALYVEAQRSQLTYSTIFSTLQFMSMIQEYNVYINWGLGFVFELNVIFERFLHIFEIKNKSMTLRSLPPPQIDYGEIKLFIKDSMPCIEMRDFSAYWRENQEHPSLSLVTLQIERGKFYGLCGPVGAGKSTFLQSILYQIPEYEGFIKVEGSISYCEQELVIFSKSVRENILFGRPFDETRYDQVVHASCLQRDFELFEYGDETEVGDKGITLSGGQKARVGLARALYSQADIYLFDDPLSAVDAKVAKNIFSNVFQKFLKDKTVIFNTHQVHFLEECSHLILMKEGRVEFCGRREQTSPQIIAEYLFFEETEPVKESEDMGMRTIKGKASEKQSSCAQIMERENKILQEQKNVQVELGLYSRFLLYSSKWKIFVSILIFFVCEGVLSAFFRIFGLYQSQAKDKILFSSDSSYWALLGGIILLYFVLCFVKLMVLSLIILASNEKIHQDMIHSLVRSHSWLFDITPSGVLSNTFSNDIGVLDNSLIFTFQQAFEGPILSIVMLINIIQINPYFAIVAFVNILVLIFIFLTFKPAIIEGKQLDLKMKSPVFNKLNQTVGGLIQIRLFSNTTEYLNSIYQDISNSWRANLFYWMSSRFLGASISSVSCLATAAGLLMGISMISDTGDYAAMIVFLITILIFLQWCFRNIINAESMMVSVARCFHLIGVSHEKPPRTDYDQKLLQIKDFAENSQSTLSLDQARNGPILQLTNFKMRYRQDLPLVIKGLNLSVQWGEKVGIVGRTGAGKSSIIQSLLRICEPEPESGYSIYGVNALELGLETLRNSISVIPQMPFLFRDSIRGNLDPFNTKSEPEIWSALEHAHLAKYIRSLPLSLSTGLSNSSSVLSVGQKQLLCLARALLRNTEIVILDEATSNVDKETDRLIQKVLKKEFGRKTVITIAHRLLTIADYDQVVVMGAGRVLERGHPYELIKQKGHFAEMVEHSSASATEIIMLAESSYRRTRPDHEI